MERCSDNMQQIYRRTPMPKCNYNKVEVQFQLSCKATLLKSHFGMGFLLYICCIFSKHLFLRTPLDSRFWTVQEITGKFIKKVKIKNDKAQVKKSSTLLNIYYFSSVFQRISLVLKPVVLLFTETDFINTILTKINLYIQ